MFDLFYFWVGGYGGALSITSCRTRPAFDAFALLCVFTFGAFTLFDSCGEERIRIASFMGEALLIRMRSSPQEPIKSINAQKCKCTKRVNTPKCNG